MSSMQPPAELVEIEKEYSVEMEIENAKRELTKLISGNKSLAPSIEVVEIEKESSMEMEIENAKTELTKLISGNKSLAPSMLRMMEIENAKTELTKLISGNKSLAPSMLRLAYAYQFTLASTAAKSHDHAASKTKSTDFQKAIDLCGQIKADYPTITYADIYQLAGVVAVKVLEGPDIKFEPARKDTSITPDEGCLPDDQLGASELRDFFYPMELGNKDIVALYGGLKLATAHSKGSGVEGSLTKEPFEFDNRYFVELLRSRIVKLPPTDKAMVVDSTFRYFVEIYEKNKQAFFEDYAEAHKTLSEYNPASSFYESARRKNTTMTQKAVGVAIAATVAILGFFYLIKRRRAREHSSQQFHKPSVPVTFDELKKLETGLNNKKENEN